MNKNCFVCEYNVELENESLPVFDILRTRIEPSTFRFGISIPVGESISWDNDVDNISIGYSGEEHVSSSPFIATDGGRTIFISGTLTKTTTFEASTKYNASKFRIFDTTGVYSYIDNIDYCTNLKDFVVQIDNTYLFSHKIDSIDLSRLSKLEYFDAGLTCKNFTGSLPQNMNMAREFSLRLDNNESPSVIGSLSSFYGAVNLSSLDLRSSHITGDIKILVEELSANKTSGSILIRAQESTVKLFNEVLTFTINCIFDSSTVQIKNSSTNELLYTYNKSTGTWS